MDSLLQDRLVSMHTRHVGAVDDWFAPHAAAVIFVGSDAKFVLSVGFQVVYDCVAGGARLIDPLPVPFSVADCVVPTMDFYTGGTDRTDRVTASNTMKLCLCLATGIIHQLHKLEELNLSSTGLG